MGGLGYLLGNFLTLARTIQAMRENRRRGILVNPTATLATAVGAILVAMLACACLAGAMAVGRPIHGIILFFVVFVGGIVGLGIAVSRRWPPPPQ